MTTAAFESHVRQQLKEVVLKIVPVKMPIEALRDDINLFDECGLDSTSIVELVMEIEEAFGITIDEDDLDIALFQSLQSLAAFIAERQHAAA